jgi:choline kinase
MRVIILAAGKGERLMPLTNNTPKSLLELANGTSVLESQLLSIHAAGIRDVAIVTGYLTEQIEAKINKYSQEYNIEFQIVYNPFYDVSNNLISLWQAKHYMNEDLIIINGDDIFKDSVIKGLINHDKSQQLCMVIDRKETYDPDDMKLIIEKDRVLRIGKQIPENKANGESIGMIRLIGDGKEWVVKTMEKMVRKKENINVFYLEIFQELINQGTMMEYYEVDADDWAEIDFHPDLEDIRKEIFNFDKDWLA